MAYGYKSRIWLSIAKRVKSHSIQRMVEMPYTPMNTATMVMGQSVPIR